MVRKGDALTVLSICDTDLATATRSRAGGILNRISLLGSKVSIYLKRAGTGLQSSDYSCCTPLVV